MAEGGTLDTPANAQGSDQTFPYECDSCKYDGAVTEGIGFCKECEEFLCGACLNVHKKSKASRSHTLLEGEDIHDARKTESPERAVWYCKVHRDKEVNLYCKYHDEVICDFCKAIDHRKCMGSDIQRVEDICDEQEADKAVTSVIEESRSLIEKFKSLQEQRREELNGLVQQREDCVQKIKVTRRELIKKLDEVENELCKKIDAFIAEQSQEISATLSTLENVMRAIEVETNKLEDIRESGQSSLVFIATRNLNLQKMNEDYTDMEKETYTVKIDFQSENEVDDVLDQERLLRRLVFQLPYRGTGPMVMHDVKDKNMVQTGKHCVKLDRGAEETCFISGLKFLPSGKLVMCDQSNVTSILKVADEAMCVQSSLVLPGKPSDVALVGGNELAVTLPFQKTLQFVRMEDQLTLGRSVNIGRICWGITCCNGKLYVTCHNNPGDAEVLVLNKRGEVEVKIVNSEGRTPFYIAVDAKERIYLSDSTTHMIVCMNNVGQTLYTYDDGELQGPLYLLVDAKRYLYVCGSASNTVQVITDKGLKYKTLLTSRDGIQAPLSLAFRSNDSTFAIGQINNDNILSFKAPMALV